MTLCPFVFLYFIERRSQRVKRTTADRKSKPSRKVFWDSASWPRPPSGRSVGINCRLTDDHGRGSPGWHQVTLEVIGQSSLFPGCEEIGACQCNLTLIALRIWMVFIRQGSVYPRLVIIANPYASNALHHPVFHGACMHVCMCMCVHVHVCTSLKRRVFKKKSQQKIWQ